VGLEVKGAAVRLLEAREDLHQGGLALTVTPHQADTLAIFEGEVRLVEQVPEAERKTQAGGVEQGQKDTSVRSGLDNSARII